MFLRLEVLISVKFKSGTTGPVELLAIEGGNP